MKSEINFYSVHTLKAFNSLTDEQKKTAYVRLVSQLKHLCETNQLSEPEVINALGYSVNTAIK